MLRCILLFAVVGLIETAGGQEPEFSGPQVGEKIAACVVEYVFDEQAGNRIDPVERADGGPIALVFVNGITRPSVALTRVVMGYAHRRAEDGLAAALVFLTDDPTEMRARLTQARHALARDVPITLSTEGRDGPGAYGLNRKVTVTVLVAQNNRVTANFALVQPSVAVDAPKIGAAIAAVLGDDKPPTLADMGAERYGQGDAREMTRVPGFRRLLAPVIRKTQLKEEVEKAAAAVEEHAKTHPAFRKRLGEVAQRIIDAGRLDSYGTPPAREYLKKWAKQYNK